MEHSILEALKKTYLLASIRLSDHATDVISIGTETGHESVGCNFLDAHVAVWWKAHFPLILERVSMT